MQSVHFLNKIQGNDLDWLYKFYLKIIIYSIYLYIYLVLHKTALLQGPIIANFRLYLLNFHLKYLIWYNYVSCCDSRLYLAAHIMSWTLGCCNSRLYIAAHIMSWTLGCCNSRLYLAAHIMSWTLGCCNSRLYLAPHIMSWTLGCCNSPYT